MKQWKFEVSWVSKGYMTVESETIEEAREKAKLIEPIPVGNYVEDSLVIRNEQLLGIVDKNK